MAEGISLGCFECRVEVDTSVIKPSYLRILIFINPSIHFPGPGEGVSIEPKRLELPILEQPELAYLETK